MSEPDDVLAAQQAADDQRRAWQRSVAEGARFLYDSLVEQGFSDEQALALTVPWVEGATSHVRVEVMGAQVFGGQLPDESD